MKNKRLKLALLATLSVITSYGVSFGRGNNYKNYSTEFNRHELSDLSDDDEDEIYYSNHHEKNSKINLYKWGGIGTLALCTLYKTVETLNSKLETNSPVENQNNALNHENEKNIKKTQPVKRNNKLKNKENVNMISFADEKKEINKMSLHNIGNTCYINTFIQPVLQFPRLIELIKGVDVKEIRKRLHNEKMCNFLTGVRRLVIEITENKKLSYDDWKSCAKLMGHTGGFGTANDLWEKLLDSVKEYYGYYWSKDELGKPIYCPGASINEFTLDTSVFDAPLDVEKKVIDEMKKQYLSEEKHLFRNSLRASFGIFRITIPSYMEALEERNGKELKGLENTFEKFTISTNGDQEIWTDYDEKVEKAEANLKAITINYPGHWIAYTKQDAGYYKHNDGSISKISKEDMMNEIIKNPIGTTLIYSINKLK